MLQTWFFTDDDNEQLQKQTSKFSVSNIKLQVFNIFNVQQIGGHFIEYFIKIAETDRMDEKSGNVGIVIYHWLYYYAHTTNNNNNID